MKDRRPVDELSIEELEEVLRLKRRETRLERLRRTDRGAESDPLAQEKSEEPSRPSPSLPTDHRRYRQMGATTQFRSRPLDEPLEEIDEPPARRGVDIQWGWVGEKALLVVELGVLAVLIILAVVMWATVQGLNQEARDAQQSQLPTLTPTPVIRVAILPGGHAPPDEAGRSAPEEIPAHLREFVSSITPLPMPTPGPEQAVRIQIPVIGVDAPVVEGDDSEMLKRGAGHHIGSANPGESDNCIISAHNDIYGEIFRDLPDLSVGDEVLVHTASRVYRYEVSQSRIIDPEDVSVMYPTSSPVLTLISCYPYGIDTHRIVVIAELKP